MTFGAAGFRGGCLTSGDFLFAAASPVDKPFAVRRPMRRARVCSIILSRSRYSAESVTSSLEAFSTCRCANGRLFDGLGERVRSICVDAPLERGDPLLRKFVGELRRDRVSRALATILSP